MNNYKQRGNHKMKRIIVILLCLWMCGCSSKDNQLPTAHSHQIQIYKESNHGFSDDAGYYYISNDGYLHFFDYESEENIIVCSRPNCPIEEDSECYLPNYVYFTYNHQFYTIERDPKDDTHSKGILVKSDLDRGNRKTIGQIPSYRILNYAIYQNKVYFAIDEVVLEYNEESGSNEVAAERECYLYIYDLESETGTKQTFDFYDFNNSLEITCANEEEILLSYHYFENEYDGTNYEEAKNHSEYYLFHVNTEELKKIDIPIGKDCFFRDAMLSNDHKLLVIETKDKTTKIVRYDLEKHQREELYECFKYPAVVDQWYFMDIHQNNYVINDVDDIQEWNQTLRDDLNLISVAKDYFLCITTEEECKFIFMKKSDYFDGKTKGIPLIEYAKE